MLAGRYINLDHAKSRRSALESHLRELGIDSSYQRIPAVLGTEASRTHASSLTPGELGCYLSHLKALAAHLDGGAEAHLHILEDDVCLVKDWAEQAERVSVAIEGGPGESPWDILFTDVLLPVDAEVAGPLTKVWLTRARSRTFVRVDLGGVPFASAASYVVHREAAGKVHALLCDRWSGNLPLDLVLRDLAATGELRAAVTVPFLSTLSSENERSTIRDGLDPSRAAFYLYRQGFFMDADHAALQHQMVALQQKAQVLPMTDLFLGALRFTMSDRFVAF